MFGRLPDLFCQVKMLQLEAQATLEDVARRGRGVGVETADRRVTDRHSAVAHRRVERDAEDRAVRQHGVAAGHVDPVRAFATPVPRLKPIQTLPSFVPTIATLLNFGEYLTWLMKERLPSVCLVMFVRRTGCWSHTRSFVGGRRR